MLIVSNSIDLVEVVERQVQKLVFILPGDLGLRKSLAFGRGRGRIGYLGDQVRSRRLCNAIHENPDERRLQDDGEAKGKTKQDAFAIEEPPTLLLWSILDATEIRLELVLSVTAGKSAWKYPPVHASNCGKQSSYGGT
jgi:hypothetical protein